MEKIIRIFESHYGYAYLQELKRQGVHTDSIRNLLKDNVIKKVKPGLYKLADIPIVAHQNMIEICLVIPKAVVCLHSALSFYELTTTNPSRVMVAIPRESKPGKNYYRPADIFYFSSKNYCSGIDIKTEKTGSFRIYNIEKTLVDCFRYRHKTGLDVAVEGLKNYIRSNNYDLQTLFDYARKGKMMNVIKPYFEALVAQ